MRDGSPNYDEAAASDAWTRLLEFFDASLTPAS
jgi:dienelactone hydrolase